MLPTEVNYRSQRSQHPLTWWAHPRSWVWFFPSGKSRWSSQSLLWGKARTKLSNSIGRSRALEPGSTPAQALAFCETSMKTNLRLHPTWVSCRWIFPDSRVLVRLAKPALSVLGSAMEWSWWSVLWIGRKCHFASPPGWYSLLHLWLLCQYSWRRRWRLRRKVPLKADCTKLLLDLAPTWDVLDSGFQQLSNLFALSNLRKAQRWETRSLLQP